MDEHMSTSLDDVIQCMREAFPSLSDKALLRKSHQEWEDLRGDLPLLLPKDVVTLLPFVLLDLTPAADDQFQRDYDMVIYFLDVLLTPVNFDDPKEREIVEKFADEQIGGEAGEQFKAMMFFRPGGCQSKSVDEERAEERRRREAHFAELTRDQERAIYRFLCYVNDCGAFCEGGKLESLERATLYWKARSGAK